MPIESREVIEVEKSLVFQPEPARPGLCLISIIAVVCLSLEIETLQQIDSLLLYMRYREIALDVGVALIVLICFAVTWWALVMLIAKAAGRTVVQSEKAIALSWRLGLAIPMSYLLLDLFGAIRLELFPHWYPGLRGWTILSIIFIGSAAGLVAVVSIKKLQDLCRTRLAPIGWLHVALGFTALLLLWSSHVHFFHDYARAGKPYHGEKSPDIYLITIDALRADDLSLYGYSRPTTPNLARFAQRASTFDYFFANSNFTTPTTTSIETGQLPWSHRLFQVGGFPRVRAQGETLAELLEERGYYTAMITSNYLASPVHHRTLKSYDAVEYAAPTDGSGPWLQATNLVGSNAQYTLFASLLQRMGGIRFYLDALIWGNKYPYPAEPVFERARSLIQRPDIAQPRFIWTHIFPPHDPYLSPPPFRSRFLDSSKLSRSADFIGFRNTTLPPGVAVSDLQARYDEMILYADQMVGDYLDWLEQTGRFDQSIVIVTADHGDSFEHNWLLHSGPNLYNGLIHIPLLIHVPGQEQSLRIAEPAQQADLLPTVLDLIGGSAPAWTDGISLKPALEGHKLPERYVYSMNLEPNPVFEPISKGTIALMDDQFKYIQYLGKRKESLFKYRVDPSEDHDLIDSEPDTAAKMRTALLNELDIVNRTLTPRP